MKTSLLIILSVIFLGGITSPAQAFKLEDCNKIQSYSGMVACEYSNKDKADQELNRVYQQVLKKYAKDKDFIQRLKKAQRAWLKFVHLHWQTYYPRSAEHTGSAWGFCSASLITDVYLERIEQLKALLIRYEGDICQAYMNESIPYDTRPEDAHE